MTNEANKPNIQKLLNAMIYKRQQEANDNPESFWLPFYDVLIRERLNEQAMEGVFRIYYKVNHRGCIQLTDKVMRDMGKESRRFWVAHEGDYL